MIVDLHVQSNCSRHGKLEPEDIIRRAKEIGLDGVCFTEDQPTAHVEELLSVAKDHAFPVFVGRSLFTDKGHLLFLPRHVQHVAEYGVFPHNLDDQTPIIYDKVVERAQQLDGILIAAHPYLLHIPRPMGDKIFDMKGLAAVEVQNGQCSSLLNDFALEATFHLKLPGVGGSQTLGTLNTLGTAVTLFCQKLESQEELVEAILSGQVWSATLQDKLEYRSRPAASGRDDRRGNDRGDRRDRGDRGDRRDRGDRGDRGNERRYDRRG